MLWQVLDVVLAAGAAAARSPQTTSLFDALGADGPPADHADRMTLYAPLIGDWEVRVVDYQADGTRRESLGEWHFGWVLEGRAVQDVFIVPARADRRGPPGPGNRYGTTLRVYDPALDAWRITWINPVTQAHNTLIGRRQGDEIVQEGKDEDGAPIRWMFSDLSRDSFRWRGEVSTDQGKTWIKGAEFFGRRVRKP